MHFIQLMSIYVNTVQIGKVVGQRILIIRVILSRVILSPSNCNTAENADCEPNRAAGRCQKRDSGTTRSVCDHTSPSPIVGDNVCAPSSDCSRNNLCCNWNGSTCNHIYFIEI